MAKGMEGGEEGNGKTGHLDKHAHKKIAIKNARGSAGEEEGR